MRRLVRAGEGKHMIVSEVMTTKLVTVFPDDTLSHAAGLLRQHQFHHLPVVQGTSSHVSWEVDQRSRERPPVLEGLITSQDIDLAAAGGRSHAAFPSLRHSYDRCRLGGETPRRAGHQLPAGRSI